MFLSLKLKKKRKRKAGAHKKKIGTWRKSNQVVRDKDR
jgi:hypothetical protein